jgi:hypothetical protein
MFMGYHLLVLSYGRWKPSSDRPRPTAGTHVPYGGISAPDTSDNNVMKEHN